VVAVFPLRRGVFVAHTQVERQLLGNFPVVLNIEEVHPLPVLRGEHVGELIGAARSEQKIGNVVYVIRGESCGCAELAAVAILPVLRTEIQNRRVDALIFEAQFQRMLGEHVRVIYFRIEYRRILGRRSSTPQFQNPTNINPRVSYTRTGSRQTLKFGIEYAAINVDVNDTNPNYGLDSYTSQFSRPAGRASGGCSTLTMRRSGASTV